MSQSYETTLQRVAGNPFAVDHLEMLLARMISRWPRRGSRLLAVSAGDAPFLENLWRAGFDLTVQSSDPESLSRASDLLKNRSEYILGMPDHLPVDDCSFDYAVVLLRRDDPVPALLRELRRAVCRGVLLVFASSTSLEALVCRLRRCPADNVCPFPLRGRAGRVFDGARFSWGSVLPGPGASWHPGFWSERLNSPFLLMPLGAVAALRIDMAAPRSGKPLLLRADRPVMTAK